MKRCSTSLIIQFSCSVVSDSLQPHESQHTRPPCQSPTPGVHPDSRPSSQWYDPAAHPQSSPSPPALNPSQHQSLFQWINSSHPGGQSTGASALASFLPKKSQGWSPSEWTGWISLQSQGLFKSLLQHHSSKASILQCSAFFTIQLSHPSLLEKCKSKLQWDITVHQSEWPSSKSL